MIAAHFNMPKGGAFFLNDMTVDVSPAIPNSYALVESFGNLGASLEGFGEAFATVNTTITIANTPEINGQRFSYYIPRYLTTTEVTIYWIFEDPDSPGTFYTETALKGPLTEASFTYDSATVTVTSQAEALMRRDLLNVTDPVNWEGCPESNIGRAIPLLVNRVNRLPAWLYSEDRTRLLIANKVAGPGVPNTFTIETKYFRGADVYEDEVIP